MSNNKQSSLDWLIAELGEYFPQGIGGIELMVKQAKAMHKEEIDKVAGDFWNEGASYVSDGQRKYNSFEQYYNEEFGGNK